MIDRLSEKARSIARGILGRGAEASTYRLVDKGSNNTIKIGKNIHISGTISGNDNTIVIEDSHLPSYFKITLNGDRNRICIGEKSRCKDMSVHIGTYLPAHETKLEIGDEFSSEAHCRLLLYNSGNVLKIGQDCMFANHIIVRCGESPHLIFDSETGDYLDTSDGVFIGDHVWVGEQSYITKRCTLPDNSILAACSVATRRFDEPNVVIAGNPAQVVREGVKWLRNRVSLEPGSPEKASHDAANAPYNTKEDT